MRDAAVNSSNEKKPYELNENLQVKTKNITKHIYVPEIQIHKGEDVYFRT